MNSFNLKPLIASAEEALTSFLETLLGEKPSFTISSPNRVTFIESGILMMESLIMLNPGTNNDGFAVVLDPGWLPLVSKAMLGESIEMGEEGADDLVRELASQGYGAVRNHFGMIGVRLPEAQFDVLTHGSQITAGQLPDDLWQITFTSQVGDLSLDGLVLLPDAPDEEEPEGSLESMMAGGQAAAPSTQAAAPRSQAAAPQTQHQSVVVSPASFPDLGNEHIGGDGENFGLLAEVELEVTVELGRRRLPLADILRLTNGSVIELENLVGEPLEVYANGRLIAEGEAVVIDEQFGIRITRLASDRQRARAFL